MRDDTRPGRPARRAGTRQPVPPAMLAAAQPGRDRNLLVGRDGFMSRAPVRVCLVTALGPRRWPLPRH